MPCARCSRGCSSRSQLQRKEREACIPTSTCSCRYCMCDHLCPHPLQQELVSTPRLSHSDRDACGSEPLSPVCTLGLRGRGGHPALTPQDTEFRKHGEQLLSQPCLPQRLQAPPTGPETHTGRAIYLLQGLCWRLNGYEKSANMSAAKNRQEHFMGVSQVGLLVTVPVLVSSPKELWLNSPCHRGSVSCAGKLWACAQQATCRPPSSERSQQGRALQGQL